MCYIKIMPQFGHWEAQKLVFRERFKVFIWLWTGGGAAIFVNGTNFQNRAINRVCYVENPPPPSGNTFPFLLLWEQVSYKAVCYKNRRKYNIKMVNFWMHWIITVSYWNSSAVSQTDLNHLDRAYCTFFSYIISSWNLK